jgi:basic membrane protein A
MAAGARTLLLVAAGALAAAGCRTREAEPGAPGPAAVTAPGFVVGFLYTGPWYDGGYNQSHAAGAAALRRLPGVTVLEEDNVPDDAGAAPAFERLVQRGAVLVFATGWGQFDPPLLEAAAKHPQVTFLHAGGYYQEGLHPPNAGSYGGYLDETFYLAGVVAGMNTHTRKLGFIAGKSVAPARRCLNAFTLGARSVDARITTSAVFGRAWSEPAAEQKAANDLVDQKVDVLAAYVNAPRTILETAERRGIFSIGVHASGAALAPKGYLTGAESSWEKMYTDYVRAAREGNRSPRIVRGGLLEGTVFLSPFGPAVSAEAQARAAQLRAQLAQGTLPIWKGPLKDNQGRELLGPGAQWLTRDIRLEATSFLVEGVLGKTPE